MDPRVKAGMDEQLRERRARLDSGNRPLGWKVGFGAPAAMEKLRIDAPLIGYLLQSALVPSGIALELGRFENPVVEPEIAIHLGADVPAGAGADEAAGAIRALGPAIEVADLTHPPEDVTEILKLNIYQRHVILGKAEKARLGARLAGLMARIDQDGAILARTDEMEANTGKLIDIVQSVSRSLSACGETLAAGEIIIAGSIVPPIFVDGPTSISYALDPVDAISVAFS